MRRKRSDFPEAAKAIPSNRNLPLEKRLQTIARSQSSNYEQEDSRCAHLGIL
jgi:hypothetical protein